jgi:hypothetical protein
MARAFGSYPKCQGFDSLRRHHVNPRLDTEKYPALYIYQGFLAPKDMKVLSHCIISNRVFLGELFYFYSWPERVVVLVLDIRRDYLEDKSTWF